MKKNRLIYKLLGQNVKIMKNVGHDALPGLMMELASYVHWHTAYQMSINSITLRGLVNPNKRVELFRLGWRQRFSGERGYFGPQDYVKAQSGPSLPMTGIFPER